MSAIPGVRDSDKAAEQTVMAAAPRTIEIILTPIGCKSYQAVRTDTGSTVYCGASPVARCWHQMKDRYGSFIRVSFRFEDDAEPFVIVDRTHQP